MVLALCGRGLARLVYSCLLVLIHERAVAELGGPVKPKKKRLGRFFLYRPHCWVSGLHGQARWLDPTHPVADQNHHEKQDGKSNPERQCTRHVIFAGYPFAV